MVDAGKRAVVIGSGIIGSDTAYELAKAGYDVTVVDKGPGPGSGSTSASSACIRFNYSTLTSVAVSYEAKLCWADWEDYLQGTDDGKLATFVECGGFSVDLPTEPGAAPREPLTDRFAQAGVPFEVLTAAEASERFPAMDFHSYYPPKPVTDDEFWEDSDRELTLTYMPDAGFMDDPQFSAHNLMAAAKRQGARFLFRHEMTGVRRGDDGSVAGVDLVGPGGETSSIDADIVVNAAGPHSAKVNQIAGVLDDFTVSTRPMRTEVHHFRAPEGYAKAQRPGPFMADTDLGIYFRGEPGGGLLNGGAEPACDELEFIDDPDSAQKTCTTKVYEAQSYRLARRFPDLQIPNAPSGVVGVYDVSSDWVPIYDKSSLPGYYVAIGTSGNQFKNAPVAGQIMRTIIDWCEGAADGTRHDHDVDPAPMRLPRLGIDVDLSEYSRKRKVDANAGGAGIFA